MNGQESAPSTALLGIIGLVAALAVLGTFLLGDSWPRGVFYGVLLVGVLVVAGSVGALVKVMGTHGR